MDLTLPASAFPPLALGFFGPGTGYLVHGTHELFGFPRRSDGADRALGVWGLFMPGLCQFLTGITLIVGLTWFQVFTRDPALYMAALAFTAYGIHWFALAWNRYQGNDARTNVGMSVAFMVLSALGGLVFFTSGGWPVGLLFIGLFLVYAAEFAHTLGSAAAVRVLGAVRLVTGSWLMYLMFAVTVNLSLHYHWPA
jgi:hypothetical protein